MKLVRWYRPRPYRRTTSCGWAPYRVEVDRSLTRRQLCRRINAFIDNFSRAGGILGIFDYRRLMQFFASRKDLFKVVDADRFLATSDQERVTVFLRHDIDLDLPNAVAMSRIETEFGLCSTYYVLHSDCAYYGSFGDDGVFRRYEVADEFIAQIHRNHQGIGLHIDPLGIIGLHAVDGIEAMCTELERIRSLGIPVTSVCSHNSASAYNANNQDVFVGRNLSGQSYVEHTDGRIPLGIVDQRDVEITSFGDFCVTTGHQEVERPYVSESGFSVDKTPVYRFEYDISFSIVLGKRWELGGNGALPLQRRSYVDDAEIYDALSSVPRGRRIMLNIHPMYYGAR